MRIAIWTVYFVSVSVYTLEAVERPTGSMVHISERDALRKRLRIADASAIVLDWKTGKVLAAEGEENPAAPGSLLKPILLSYALEHGIVTDHTRVYCRRDLYVAGRHLACTHPADQPVLDAEMALAESCNTWFASLARHMSGHDLQAALQQAHLSYGLANYGDADTRVLAVLGLAHIASTPLQLAIAYRALLLREARNGVVWNGLRGSVSYGMANQARVQGLEVLGKTGTASDPGTWWSHGWFAGGVPGRFVLVVYTRHGDGGTAATLAGSVMRLFAHEVAQ